jgi:hypothetical protein
MLQAWGGPGTFRYLSSWRQAFSSASSRSCQTSSCEGGERVRWFPWDEVLASRTAEASSSVSLRHWAMKDDDRGSATAASNRYGTLPGPVGVTAPLSRPAGSDFPAGPFEPTAVIARSATATDTRARSPEGLGTGSRHAEAASGSSSGPRRVTDASAEDFQSGNRLRLSRPKPWAYAAYAFRRSGRGNGWQT